MESSANSLGGELEEKVLRKSKKDSQQVVTSHASTILIKVLKSAQIKDVALSHLR